MVTVIPEPLGTRNRNRDEDKDHMLVSTPRPWTGGEDAGPSAVVDSRPEHLVTRSMRFDRALARRRLPRYFQRNSEAGRLTWNRTWTEPASALPTMDGNVPVPHGSSREDIAIIVNNARYPTATAYAAADAA
ncbi:hypothetical protein EVAR_102625_1 [Eumeta japonica]|uniref:Uncharacterized protein n=1 Tax=Eumeta variegata TaxID=151549 RepID=A0A4C1TVM0_EUMVA|nr:hypothetical protein EVAR_102625_1 [Eumeta japonica]